LAPTDFSSLRGVRVLDFTRLLPGPYGSLLLSGLGAEVIKVETPTQNDYTRQIGPELFATVNRYKKAILVDYRKPEGREVMLRMAEQAQVVFEGFRPGAMAAWGLGYEDFRQRNASIVYCSLSGYGQEGAYRDRAGHDLNYMAVSGLLGLMGEIRHHGAAPNPEFPIGDVTSGMMAALAICAAVAGAARTGQGGYLDVAILDPVFSIAVALNGARPTGRSPQFDLLNMPMYNVYETADGQYFTLGNVEPHFLRNFCAAVERPDLADRGADPETGLILAELMRTRTRAEWSALFEEIDTCWAPVHTPVEALYDPHLRDRGLVVDGQSGPEFAVALPFAKPAEDRPAPALGQDTLAVLAEFGLSQAEIDALLAAGIIG